MRVCPKCGYSENLLWQQDRFCANAMFMRLEDFSAEYPSLFEKLGKGKDIIEDNYIYRMKTKKAKYVRRLEIIGGNDCFDYEGNAKGWTAKRLKKALKKVQAFRSKSQTKLLEIEIK